MIAIDYDPFALGYVASLARPGGNLNGLFYQQIDLTLKRLELMKDAGAARVEDDGVFGTPRRRANGVRRSAPHRRWACSLPESNCANSPMTMNAPSLRRPPIIEARWCR